MAANSMTQMTPYPAYRDTGIPWLGQIPAHWEAKRLKYIARFVYGDSLAAENREDGDIQVYGSNGIVGTHSKSNTNSPCLVIGRKGSYGKVNYSDVPCFAIDTTYFVDPKSTQDDIRFLFYALPLLKLDEMSQDTGVPGLSREFAYNQWLPHPSLSEQCLIAAFLDRQTAKIDALIAKKQRLLELLAEQRAVLINQAVTKGLNPAAKMKDSDVAWLGHTPAHWNVAPLGNYAKMIVPMRDKPQELHGDIPWIRIEDFTGKYLSGSKSGQGVDLGTIRTMNLKVFPIGTVLCSCSCNMGVTAIVSRPLISNQTFIGIVPQPRLFSDYVYYLLKVGQQHLNAIATGAIQQYLSRNDFQRLRVPIPPLPEQRTITIYLDRATARIDALCAKVETAIERLREYRSALVSAAVTGKMDVREPSTSPGG